MKMIITAVAVVGLTLGATAAYAGGGCGSKHVCADGFTYDKAKGGCVKIATSS